MGLCLGHDILLQKNLTMEFTVFAVKNRVTGYHLLMGLPDAQPPEAVFSQNMPDAFYLMPPEELQKLLKNKKSPKDFYLLDLRGKKAFAPKSLPGSLNILLADPPQKYRSLRDGLPG